MASSPLSTSQGSQARPTEALDVAAPQVAKATRNSLPRVSTGSLGIAFTTAAPPDAMDRGGHRYARSPSPPPRGTGGLRASAGLADLPLRLSADPLLQELRRDPGMAAHAEARTRELVEDVMRSHHATQLTHLENEAAAKVRATTHSLRQSPLRLCSALDELGNESLYGWGLLVGCRMWNCMQHAAMWSGCRARCARCRVARRRRQMRCRGSARVRTRCRCRHVPSLPDWVPIWLATLGWREVVMAVHED